LKKDLTEIVMIIDRSGSMISIQKDAQGGFNNFIKKQRELPGEAKITLVQFDSFIETVHNNVNINDIPEYILEPRGATSLLDAIGFTLNLVGDRLSETIETEKPSKILVCIITDGQENSSNKFNKSQIKEIIDHQTNKYSWEFIFIGANIDTISEASSIGINTAASFCCTETGTRNIFEYANNITTSYRAGNIIAKTHTVIDS